MESKLTFHINNMAYTISVDQGLKEELTRNLDANKNVDTKELLTAYIRLAQEFNSAKQDIEQITNKIPNF
ncbi:MAG: hypothetical protein ACNI25_08405 [Halarcobacter sp.]